MLYFEFFKMTLNYKNEETLYVIFFLKRLLNTKMKTPYMLYFSYMLDFFLYVIF